MSIPVARLWRNTWEPRYSDSTPALSEAWQAMFRIDTPADQPRYRVADFTDEIAAEAAEGAFVGRAREVERLIDKKIINAGMIPKARACINAAKGGVKKAHILNAGIPHALLLEIFTDKGIGTEIVK